MKRVLSCTMLLAVIFFAFPVFADDYIASWSTLSAGLTIPPPVAKIKVKYVDTNTGINETIGFTITSTTGGPEQYYGEFKIDGPDSSGNFFVGIFTANDAESYVQLYSVGTGMTKGNTTRILSSLVEGIESSPYYSFIQYAGNYLYMNSTDGNAGDINASYAETRLVINPRTDTASFEIKETVTGLLHTQDGDFPAVITVTASAENIPRGKSYYTDFHRPFSP